MPYIKPEDRCRLEDYFNSKYPAPGTPGELNYLFTQLINIYIHQNDRLNYLAINDCIGALECAKFELYRRVAAPYEDRKIDENGDVDYPV